MLVAFARCSRDNSFTVAAANKTFVIVMAAGSITGTLIGGLLLGVVPATDLIPLLVTMPDRASASRPGTYMGEPLGHCANGAVGADLPAAKPLRSTSRCTISFQEHPHAAVAR